MCEDVLCESSSGTKIGNLHFLFLAEQFGLKKLQELCVEKSKNTKISDLIKQKHYQEISKEVLVEILEYQAKRMENGRRTISYCTNNSLNTNKWPNIPNCTCN